MKIFVSYSRRDAGDFANQIQKHLSTFNYEIFTDDHSIKAGETWSNIIEENISNCDIFVAIITHGALHSSHVEKEVLQAQKEKKIIIPCFHKDVSTNDIKWGLDQIQGVEFDDKFELARNIHSKITNSKDTAGIFRSISKIKENSVISGNEDFDDLDKKLQQKKHAIEQSNKFYNLEKDNQKKPDLKNIRIDDERKKSLVDYSIKKRRRRKAKIIIASILAFFIIGFIALVVYNIIISAERYNLTDRGLALINLGNYDRAIEYFDKVLEKDPNYVYALNGKGWALSELNKYKEAIGYFDKALAIDPNYVPALNNKGWALNSLGKYQDAIEYLDEALAIDPNYVYALNNKGWALSELNKYKEAIGYFDKALEEDPNYVTALNNKGRALSELNKYKEAIGYFDKALEEDPNNVYVLKNKGWAIANLGNYEKAIGFFDKGLSINPEDEHLYILKGLALGDLGKNDDAIIELNKALKIDPNNQMAIKLKNSLN